MIPCICGQQVSNLSQDTKQNHYFNIKGHNHQKVFMLAHFLSEGRSGQYCCVQRLNQNQSIYSQDIQF